MTPKEFEPIAQEWVGLTDQEIADLAVFIGMTHVDVPTLIAFIRSVEEKLKERNL
jgi:ABC-type spermidine/putrescine transport system permease subunit I